MVDIEKRPWIIHVFPVILPTVRLAVVDFLREHFGDQNLVSEEVLDPTGIRLTSDSVIIERVTLFNVETQVDQAFVARPLNSRAN